MTVGIAALARNGAAIVLMADRRLTWGGRLHAESTAPKIVPLPHGYWALWSGEATLAEAVTGGVDEDVKPDEIARQLWESYRTIREKAIVRMVLEPRLLTKATYMERPRDMLPLAERLQTEIDTEVASFVFQCELLICGFHEGSGLIFTLGAQGTHHAYEGYACIGSGAEAALSALVFNEINPEDDVDVQLYDLLYAKAHAEDTPYVGYEMDAWIMTPEKGLIEVRKDIAGTEDATLDRVFEWHTRSPFTVRPEWKAQPGYERPRRPRPDWEKRLKDYCDEVAGKWR